MLNLRLALSLQLKLFLAFEGLALITVLLAAGSFYLVPHWPLLTLSAGMLLIGIIAYFLAVHFNKHVDQLAKNSIAPKSNDDITRLAVRMHNLSLTENYEREFMLIPAIEALTNALEAKDNYTFGHSSEVATISMDVARELKLSQEELFKLNVASILHDVGKIGIPDQVLNKPDKLTSDEYDLIKLHPSIGAKIIASIPSPTEIATMIRHHHARWDGAGYPDNLAGAGIPLGSRIIAVADCYQAIVSDRPYRKGRSHEEAVEEIRRCSGSQFDPLVVEAFLRVYSKKTEEKQAEPA
ncbi:HD-GYP domain-containing protein [Anaerospora sp.]|jgi:putative nucleotidyltransferase with HDIG domain|uniref:HD-GYP domain-containing protein n=1 Tax=Anaerospora sp. TaxID=1960278 RepID=UPI00289D0E74|nr:HD-GYP domain-containing protein [Anaerospora sp.]MDF2929243.1 rpfG 2 [Anaerospora sp.]